MVKRILILNLPNPEFPGMDDLQTVLSGLHHACLINTLCLSDTQISLRKKLQYTDLLIIPGPLIFGYFGNSLFEDIISYYQSGGSIIYDAYPNDTSQQNEFLNNFEMRCTDIRLRGRYAYDIPFADTPHSFRDRYFYKEIDQIIMSGPNHIEYWGASQPILVSNGSFLAIDGKSDSIEHFESNKITSIVINENTDNGLFLCLYGEIKINGLPCEQDQVKNLRFLQNIFNILLNRKSRYEIAYILCREVEKQLLKIIKNVLKIDNDMDWMAYIPDNVIKDIKQNRPDSDKLEHAFNFIQLKKIISNNWSIFKEVLNHNGDGKGKALSWIDKINENRKIIAHAVKDPEDKMITYKVINELKITKAFLMKISN